MTQLFSQLKTAIINSLPSWFLLRLMLRLPAQRHAREWQLTQGAILQMAAVISCPISGYSYERLEASCRKVALLYPQPAYRTLEKLIVDIVNSEPTTLAHAFYNEYCKKTTQP